MPKLPDRIESSQTKEHKAEGIALSSVAEQEAVLASSIEYLMQHTRNEVYSIDGPVDETGLKHLDNLRDIVKRLSVNLGKRENYSPAGWLFMGIVEFISQDQLRKWTKPTGKQEDVDNLNYANYFLNRKRETTSISKE
jgi:hypothetical protein